MAKNPCVKLESDVTAWVLARIAPRVDFMPFGYCLMLTKPA